MVPRLHESCLWCFCLSTSLTPLEPSIRGCHIHQESRMVPAFCAPKVSGHPEHLLYVSRAQKREEREAMFQKQRFGWVRTFPIHAYLARGLSKGAIRPPKATAAVIDIARRTCQTARCVGTILRHRSLRCSQQQVPVNCRFADKGLGLLRIISIDAFVWKVELKMLDIVTTRELALAAC